MQDLFDFDSDGVDGNSFVATPIPEPKPKPARKRATKATKAAETALAPEPAVGINDTAPNALVVPDMGVNVAGAKTLSVPGGLDADGKFYIYGKSWIVLQNRLLHAISNLTLNERRLVLFLSPMVRADVEQHPNKAERIFTIHAADFADQYQMDKSNVYRILAEAADSILTKAFWFWDFETNQKKPNRRGSSWVDNCVYRNAEGCIDVRLSSLVVEMLTVFDKHNPYTKYKKDWVVHLGRYGIDLFEIMMSTAYKREHSVTHTLEYLREKFDCTDKYPLFSSFRRYALEVAIEEIERSTPYRVQYTPVRVGRSVKEITFHFAHTGPTDENANVILELLDSTEDAVRIEFKGIRVAIPDTIQKEALKQYDNNQVAIEYSIKAANNYIDNMASKGREVNNLQGVYISALRDNWGAPLLDQELQEQREAEERRLEKQRKKEEAERRKRELELRYQQAVSAYESLPAPVKEIVLDTLSSSLPTKMLRDKFAFIRGVCAETGLSHPFDNSEFHNYFLQVMEGGYGKKDA